MLKIKSLDVSYGDIQVLHQIGISVEKGEKICLVGSNGTGKTTLLKSVCGWVKPKCGEVIFLDKRIDTLNASKIVEAGLVMVPEGRLLFPLMTVLENLELGAYNSRAKIRKNENLKKVYEFFPILYERRDQMAGTLSGGEQQMLAIARALMSSPILLLLDEPSLGLAPLVVREIFDFINNINKEGVTVLLVEQNVYHALSISNRGYILENGRVILEGKSDELLGKESVREAYLGI